MTEIHRERFEVSGDARGRLLQILSRYVDVLDKALDERQAQGDVPAEGEEWLNEGTTKESMVVLASIIGTYAARYPGEWSQIGQLLLDAEDLDTTVGHLRDALRMAEVIR